MINSTSNKQVRRVAELVKKARARRKEDLYVVEESACAGSFRLIR